MMQPAEQISHSDDLSTFRPRFPKALKRLMAVAALAVTGACTIDYSPSGRYVGQNGPVRADSGGDAGGDAGPDAAGTPDAFFADGGADGSDGATFSDAGDAGGRDSGRNEDEDGGRNRDAGGRDAGREEDGGRRSDAGGNRPDAGGRADAGGEHPDSGHPFADAGGEDAGCQQCPSEDGGNATDAGARADAGGHTDAGNHTDAGTPHADAGTHTDGGSPPHCPSFGCIDGIGKCEARGNLICDSAGNITGCSAIPGQPDPAETCDNGIDDNCNTLVDDGCNCPPGATQPCYTGAPETRSKGLCHDGVLYCDIATQKWNPTCIGEKTPVPEECDNGLDDNCNSEADENCDIGRPCAVGEGACRREGTTEEGADGGVACSAIPGEPAPTEICGNGIDDNCANGIDSIADGCECTPGETQPCYQAEPATRNVGSCSDGQQSCPDGHWNGACENQSVPVPETCNGANDDCDTETDEGCGLGDQCFEGKGVCRTEGQIVLDGQGGTKCSAQPGSPAETPNESSCNALDDDCDGLTDETYSQQNQPCSAGQGECYRAGTVLCDPPGTLRCGVLPGAPGTEICDGANNDCDGTTDEGCPCSAGVGVCARVGIIQELTGACNAIPGDPNPNGETCNGLDDNCNGDIDETFPESGPCTAGIGACERTGQKVCNSETGEVTCSAVPGDPNPNGEICNGGVDDDCDTQTDEEGATGCLNRYQDDDNDTYGASDQHCLCNPQPPFTAIRGGDCADDNPDIHPEVQEICNGEDDNCINGIDETFPHQGETCVNLCKLGNCSRGFIDCSNGQTICHTPSPTQESCDASNNMGNGVDEDCDGSVDESCSCPVSFEGQNRDCHLQRNDCNPPAGGGQPRAYQLCIAGSTRWDTCNCTDGVNPNFCR